MSKNKNQDESQDKVVASVPEKIEKILPPIAQLKDKIKKRVHKETNQAVEEALVNLELVKRKDAVLKGLERLDQLEKEGKKIKPDQSTFNSDGTEEIKFSKAKWEEKKKNEKAVEDITNALNDALDKGDYQKLNNILGLNKGEQQNNN